MNGAWHGAPVLPGIGDDCRAPLRTADDNQLRHAFLLTPLSALRPLSGPEDVQRTACELLAFGLGVARVAYQLKHAPEAEGVVLDLNLGDGIRGGLADFLLASGIPFLFAAGHGEDVIPPRFDHVACRRSRCPPPSWRKRLAAVQLREQNRRAS